jgi:hypothetical protein
MHVQITSGRFSTALKTVAGTGGGHRLGTACVVPRMTHRARALVLQAGRKAPADHLAAARRDEASRPRHPTAAFPSC